MCCAEDSGVVRRRIPAAGRRRQPQAGDARYVRACNAAPVAFAARRRGAKVKPCDGRGEQPIGSAALTTSPGAVPPTPNLRCPPTMDQVFTIEPASTRPLWVLAVIAAFLLALLLLFGFFAYSSRNTRFEVTPLGLDIRGTLYGRSIAWADLDVEQARTVDLREASELQPTLRTNGVGLPGYQLGWFRLRRQGRGLLFLTDRSRVVALPTRAGYTILLSVHEPDAFLEALRRAAPTSSSGG